MPRAFDEFTEKPGTVFVTITRYWLNRSDVTFQGDKALTDDPLSLQRLRNAQLFSSRRILWALPRQDIGVALGCSSALREPRLARVPMDHD